MKRREGKCGEKKAKKKRGRKGRREKDGDRKEQETHDMLSGLLLLQSWSPDPLGLVQGLIRIRLNS